MQVCRPIVAVVAVVGLLTNVPTLRAAQAPGALPKDRPAQALTDKKTEFLRLTRDNHKAPLALEAAIVRFVPQDCGKSSPTVDLVSAVHIGEKSYYDQLNTTFSKYDVVLYELVAPEGTRVPRGGGNPNNPVSSLQTLLTDILKLEYQLRVVDYTRANMVHADLSPEQFSEAMRKRGESFWTMFLRMMGHALNQQGQGPSDMQLVLALFNKNRALALKRVMAEQFQDLGGSMAAIEGPDGSAIISDRNKRALEVLDKQIKAGKKKIAIFYGAGHMADFENRLRLDFGLAPIETRWLTAWDLKDKKDAKDRRDAKDKKNHRPG